MTYARWRDAFAQAMDPRLYTIGHLDALLGSMQAQIWFADNAALVTQLLTFPTGAVVIEVVVAAGDMGEIVNDLRPRAEQWAKEQAGCSFVIVESREGWQRPLRPHGYRAFQTRLIKEL